MTSNLIMWSGASVLVVNDDTFASLTEDQQAALHQAAIDAMDSMVDATRAEEDEAFGALCDAGLPMVTASDEQLAGIRATLQPVYDEIASHGENGEVLDQIAALKEELAVPPDGPTCEAEHAGETTVVHSTDDAASSLNGTYEWTITLDDALAFGEPIDPSPESYPDTFFTATLQDGELVDVPYGFVAVHPVRDVRPVA